MPKRTSLRLPGLKRQARREGWLRWVRSEADERAMLNGCWFDVEAGEAVVEFFPTFLCHSKGKWAGQPFELLDWQRDDLIMPLFGWKKENGFRRFTRAYVEIPKKNGKSTIASGLGLYMLAGDGEMGAEVYSTATDIKQAGIVHGEAINMVDASPALSEALKVNRSNNRIMFPETKSVYRALSSLANSQEGLNGNCFIADELHAWRGRKLFDAIRYGMASRDQGLFFMITTAGDDELSVCREQHNYAQQILKGQAFDDRFFGYIRAADPDDDWLSPETWAKANPSFGATFNADDFAADAKEASDSPASVSSFKRYRLDIWSTGVDPWLAPGAWAGCGLEFHESDLAGWDCWAGLDLAKTEDTTSAQFFFPDDDGGGFLLSRFWLPMETAKALEGRVPWLQWADDGFVTLTDGDVCDYDFVEKEILRLAEIYNVQCLHYDPLQAEKLTQSLSENGGFPREKFGQTILNFAEPTAEFERMVLARLIAHNRHPVMSWQMGNAQVKTDVNCNKRPVKPRPKDFRKIDGPVAGIMAVGGWMLDRDDDDVSPYRERGMRQL